MIIIEMIIALLGLTAVSLAATAPVASAQPGRTCDLRGQEIRASDGAPIAGMAVSTPRVAGPTDNIASTVTGRDGRWSLPVPWRSTYYVWFSHPEYEPVTERFVLDFDCGIVGRLVVSKTPEAAIDHFLASENLGAEITEVHPIAEHFNIRTFLGTCEGCSTTWRIFVRQSSLVSPDEGWWNVIARVAEPTPATDGRRIGPGFTASEWGQHGFHLSIGPDGQARIEWNAGRATLGEAQVRFRGGWGATSYGEVTRSSDHAAVPVEHIALTLLPGGIAWLSWDDHGTVLCGDAPDGNLVAELIGQPCF